MPEPSPEYLQRRDEIVTTAALVFRRDGYETGSLDDVAAKLGLRKSSLYYYVQSKAELLYLIFDRALTVALDRLEEFAHLSDPRHRLGALISHHARLMTEESQLFAVFFDSRPRLDESYERAILSKERRYVRIYAEAVQAAVEGGHIPEMDPRYGAQAILGMTTWSYKWFDPQRDDREALIDAYVRLILRGPVPGADVSGVTTGR